MGGRHIGVLYLLAAVCFCSAHARPAPAAGTAPRAKANVKPPASPRPATTADAALHGTWVGEPAVDEAALRASVAKNPKYRDDVEGNLRAALREFAGLKVVYTFNADGSGVVRRVTAARPNHRLPIRWAFDGKNRVDVTVLGPEEKRGETLVIRFDGADRFTVVDFARWVPTKAPVTFERGDPPDEQAATGPVAAAGGAAPAGAAAFHGTWVATPRLSGKAVRDVISADPRYKDDPEGHAARFAESLAGLRVVYTFNEDGTGTRRYLSAATAGETPIRWTFDGQDTIAVTILKPKERPGETLTVRVDGADRFVVTTFKQWLPVEQPVTFERGEAPAAVAGRPAASPPGVPDEALAKVGAKLAEVLEKLLEDANASDSTPEAPMAVSYRAVSAERVGPAGGRIVLNRVVIRPDGTSSYEELSQLEVLVTREGGVWGLSGGKTVVDFDRGPGRRTEGLPPETRKALKMAQGLKVPLAQELTDADKPLGGPPGDELKLLAAGLARDVEAGLRRNAAAVPEMHAPKVRVLSVSRTKGGASFVMMTEGEASGVVAEGGPTEFVTARADLKITLRKAAGGGWQCVRATHQLTDLTGRRGPLMSGRGPERDLTAEVQEWLDAAVPAPTRQRAPARPAADGKA